MIEDWFCATAEPHETVFVRDPGPPLGTGGAGACHAAGASNPFLVPEWRFILRDRS